VTAVSMVHEVAPQAKVVLVWPAAVVPIGGDARVEPAKILRDLGPAVEHVIAASAALTETFERPDWIDKVRKDPATLRNKLLAGGAVAAKRPSVTRLQRRGKRLHPKRPAKDETDVERRDNVAAPVVVLPVGVAGAESEPILDLVGAGAAAAATTGADDERSEWNRRLGTLALSGAAAVSALVLALALGGGRVPVSVLRGSGILPPGVPGLVQGPAGAVGFVGPFGAGALGGAGYDPAASAAARNAADQDQDQDQGQDQGSNMDGSDGGFGGDLLAPGFAGDADEEPPNDVPDDTGGENGGNGGGGNGGGGNGGGGNGGGGNGGGGNESPDSVMPGRSGEHNPHGGPPPKLGLTPAHGPGLGSGVAEDGPPGHAHKK
jgi:hypothetical protein